MKSERIYAAIGQVEDALLDELDDNGDSKKRKPPWLKWGAMAACLALVVFAAARLLPGGTHFASHAYQAPEDTATESLVISAYEETPGVGVFSCYAMPEPGTWFYVSDVSAALEEYAGQEVTYLLAMDISSDPSTDARLTEDALNAELSRLIALGLDVGYIETWEHEGADGRFYHYVPAGYFSAEQLENFPASEDYSYAFYFITDGDGKAIPAQQGLITDYSFGYGIGVR